MCVPSVLDKHPNHHDKDDNVKKQDGKDGAEESTKEHCRINDKTAAGKNENKSTECHLMHWAIVNLQSLNIWCGSAYDKISAEYIWEV